MPTISGGPGRIIGRRRGSATGWCRTGPDLEVDVFAGIDRSAGGGDSFGGGPMFRLWW